MSSKETLIISSFVIPAKAGIQKFKDLDSGLRRNDELFRPSLNKHRGGVGTAPHYPSLITPALHTAGVAAQQTRCMLRQNTVQPRADIRDLLHAYAVRHAIGV